MMSYILSAASLAKLVGVHPDLISVVKKAIVLTKVDFLVLEGLRSACRETTLVAQGASTTMHSRHLDGHAIDLGACPCGVLSWDYSYYSQIAEAMKDAANELKILIEWGGDWTTFKDGTHFQLPWASYPPHYTI